MILSNEPGYYRTDAYGIRIENLILVTEAAPVLGAEKPLNAFETLTLAPIAPKPQNPKSLKKEQPNDILNNFMKNLNSIAFQIGPTSN